MKFLKNLYHNADGTRSLMLCLKGWHGTGPAQIYVCTRKVPLHNGGFCNGCITKQCILKLVLHIFSDKDDSDKIYNCLSFFY
jgi:hypothetical protein